MKLFDRVKNSYKAFKENEQSDNSVLTQEKSTFVSTYYDKSQLMPYNPDEVYQKTGNLNKYDEMLTDDQVKAVMEMKKFSVLCKGGDVQPNDRDEDQEKQKEMADFLNYCFTDGMVGSFSRVLLKIMTAYQYGFNVSEKIFKKIQGGLYDGKIGLHKIKSRPPHGFQFQVDTGGNLEKLIQDDKTESPLELKYFIIYSYNVDFDGNFYGNSDLRAAYTPWWDKRFLRKFRNVRNERFGMPTVMGMYPHGAGDKEIKALFDMVKNLQSKSCGVFPRYRKEKADEIIAFVESKMKQGSGDVYESGLQYEDRCIARAMLMPNLLGFVDSKFGSKANADTQFNLFLNIIEFLRQEIEEEVVFEQIIKQLIDINYSDVTFYPKYKFFPISEEDKLKMFEQFNSAVENGVIIPTSGDEEHIRKGLDFPIPGKGEKRRTKPEVKNQGDDIEIPEEKNFKLKKYKRPFTLHEQKFNFAEVEKELDGLEDVAVSEAQKTIVKIKDDLIKKVLKARPTEDNDITFIKELKLTKTRDLNETWKKHLVSSYQTGRMRAKKTVKSLHMANLVILDLPPVKAIQYFNAQAFAMAGTIDSTVKKQAKQILMTGLRQGKSTKEVIFNLEKMFQPWVEGNVVSGSVIEPWRLETMARTNFSTAYNQGSKEEYQQDDFVEAYQWSSILDDDTTEYCEAMDGQIFDKNNPAFQFAPAHFSCRSLSIPITKGESYKLSDKNPEAPGSGITRGTGF